jgi:hypothetical protein
LSTIEFKKSHLREKQPQVGDNSDLHVLERINHEFLTEGRVILLAAQNDAFIESPFPRVTLEQRQNRHFLSESCFVKSINAGRATIKQVSQTNSKPTTLVFTLPFGSTTTAIEIRFIRRTGCVSHG